MSQCRVFHHNNNSAENTYLPRCESGHAFPILLVNSGLPDANHSCVYSYSQISLHVSTRFSYSHKLAPSLGTALVTKPSGTLHGAGKYRHLYMFILDPRAVVYARATSSTNRCNFD